MNQTVKECDCSLRILATPEAKNSKNQQLQDVLFNTVLELSGTFQDVSKLFSWSTPLCNFLALVGLHMFALLLMT